MNLKQHADGTFEELDTYDVGFRRGAVDVIITSAQLKALNATPVQLVGAPGTNLALVFLGATLYLPFLTTAYGAPNAAADLGIKYTNGSGAEVSPRIETTGFINSGSSAIRYVNQAASGAIGAVGDITPVSNAALVLHNVSANEYVTGDSTLKIRVFYKVIKTVF